MGLVCCTDTAQAYKNKSEAGLAIRDGPHLHSEILIMTKYAVLYWKTIEQSIADSLEHVRTLASSFVSMSFH